MALYVAALMLCSSMCSSLSFSVYIYNVIHYCNIDKRLTYPDADDTSDSDDTDTKGSKSKSSSSKLWPCLGVHCYAWFYFRPAGLHRRTCCIECCCISALLHQRSASMIHNKVCIAGTCTCRRSSALMIGLSVLVAFLALLFLKIGEAACD